MKPPGSMLWDNAGCQPDEPIIAWAIDLSVGGSPTPSRTLHLHPTRHLHPDITQPPQRLPLPRRRSRPITTPALPHGSRPAPMPDHRPHRISAVPRHRSDLADVEQLLIVALQRRPRWPHMLPHEPLHLALIEFERAATPTDRPRPRLMRSPRLRHGVATPPLPLGDLAIRQCHGLFLSPFSATAVTQRTAAPAAVPGRR